ncbi:alpha/beta hydrolase [Candidatus Saccharibacteria bacterium]|nr:alpha/beta hydrolase [Candidatus Saccharibacteria bacterium]
MPKSKNKRGVKDPADYVFPLLMNGLQGRMLKMPAPKNKTRHILFVYGHHASLERQFGVMQVLNKYGSVTMPDLPGFGGMDSFYKIGITPTLDNLADYLAAFVKLRYKQKKVTIVAMSLGFSIVTRMLQRSPELTSKVNLLVSVVGFVNHEEFIFSKRNYRLLSIGSSLFSRRLPAAIIKYLVLRPALIRATYNHVGDNHAKLMDADAEERKKRIDFEVELWRCNDVRTYMKTGHAMLKIDLLNEKIDLPVYHIGVQDDRYFDNNIVEQHLAVIYRKVNIIPTDFEHHGPTVIATAEDAEQYIPKRLRRILARRP